MIPKSGAINRGFTLVELLVVVAMIAIIAGSFTLSMSSSMQRARIQKATSEVKSLTQAFLAYENYKKSLEKVDDKEVTVGNFPYLFGKGTSAEGGSIPVLVQASLTAQGAMLDPWGRPYVVTIRNDSIKPVTLADVQTGYYLPNFNRLTKDERNLKARKGAGK